MQNVSSIEELKSHGSLGISVIISALLLIILSGKAASFVSNGYHTALAKNAITTSNLSTEIKQLATAKIKEAIKSLKVASGSRIMVTLTGFPHQTSEAVAQIQTNTHCAGGGGVAALSMPGIGNGRIFGDCFQKTLEEREFPPVIEIKIIDPPGQLDTSSAVAKFVIKSGTSASSQMNIPGIGEGQATVKLFL